MPRYALLGCACWIAASGVAATTAHATGNDASSLQLSGDTTVKQRFNVSAMALPEALGAFSRQTGIRLEVDLGAALGATSRRVAGTLTPPAALRELLAGTGLTATFVDGETARVTRVGAGAVVTLTPLVVVGARGRGYGTTRTTSATKTDTPLRDVPQSVSVIPGRLMADQSMQGMADVVRYIPGIAMGQGEGHRDAPTIRGNSSTADFFVDGMRDDAQYYRDLYNTEQVEALKGPNAMIFGRGGGGGVLNRVSKVAQWVPTRNLTVEAGSFEHARTTLDVGQGITGMIAARVNGVHEKSGGFRDAADRKRYGVNPTVTAAVGARTTVRAGYEHFTDERRVDRGIPSFQGRPSGAPRTTFFGNPAVNYATIDINAATASVEHMMAGGVTLRSRARFADYDKFYQNSLPGAVNATGTEVALTAYNQALGRRNVFNQADVIVNATAGAMRHTLLLGGEVGWQESRGLRQTGYYNGTAATLSVPFAAPTVTTPISFRPSATDGDSRTTAAIAGLYVQDQLTLSSHWQAIVGVRVDRFRLDFHNYRTSDDLERDDDLISPRAGLVFKPMPAVSLYGSYSVSHLPGSGDQFSSLTVTTRTLEPERFTNYELGAKWDVRPSLALTAAAYHLDRTNTIAPHPTDPTRSVQTGSQRTRGLELGALGNVTSQWRIAGAVAWQAAEVTSTTASAPDGATVPLVPERTVSLWNRLQLVRAVGVGVGVIHQSDMFAAIDNAVTLPGFTRADGALYVQLHPLVNVQLNVENLFDELYYPTSHGNNNIMPGAPRTLRISITTRPSGN